MEDGQGIKKRIGYWLTEKKSRRLNIDGFEVLCRSAGIELVKLNLDRPLDHQGPFDLILHKLTDQFVQTQEGKQYAQHQIHNVQSYVASHPHVIMIDPIDNVMQVLDRHTQYQCVKDCDTVEEDFHYFIPSFVEITTHDRDEIKRLMSENNIQYPFVCKPNISHVTTGQTAGEREEMAIIFNDKSLGDIPVPCVAQSFINHNARLFKIFIISKRHFITQRPSIKNLYAGEDKKTIYFDSNDISKSYSSCFLNKMEESALELPVIDPAPKKMKHLARGIQKKFGLNLLGIDVIIENRTGRYGVIDINAFPGYDGVTEFFPSLLDLLNEKLEAAATPPNVRRPSLSDSNSSVTFQALKANPDGTYTIDFEYDDSSQGAFFKYPNGAIFHDENGCGDFVRQPPPQFVQYIDGGVNCKQLGAFHSVSMPPKSIDDADCYMECNGV